MDKIKTDNQTLKKFSIVMFFALMIIGTLLFFKHKNSFVIFYLIAIIFFVIGRVAVKLLKPVYTMWMKLAFVLSWINTRVILFIIFYLIITSISLIMKLFKADPLDLKIDRCKQSYWNRKEKKPLNYEKQY